MLSNIARPASSSHSIEAGGGALVAGGHATLNACSNKVADMTVPQPTDKLLTVNAKREVPFACLFRSTGFNYTKQKWCSDCCSMSEPWTPSFMLKNQRPSMAAACSQLQSVHARPPLTGLAARSLQLILFFHGCRCSSRKVSHSCLH